MDPMSAAASSYSCCRGLSSTGANRAMPRVSRSACSVGDRAIPQAAQLLAYGVDIDLRDPEVELVGEVAFERLAQRVVETVTVVLRERLRGGFQSLPGHAVGSPAAPAAHVRHRPFTAALPEEQQEEGGPGALMPAIHGTEPNNS